MNKYNEHFDFKFITKKQVNTLFLILSLLSLIFLVSFIKNALTQKEFYFDWNNKPLSLEEYNELRWKAIENLKNKSFFE